LRTGTTCFIAAWWRGANMNPKPISSMQVATAILLAAILSFLGLGVQPPGISIPPASDIDVLHAIGVAAAQRPCCVPRQQSFDLMALRLFAYRVHGQPLSIPSDLSSSASRLRA
jgi:hypothetical protein